MKLCGNINVQTLYKQCVTKVCEYLSTNYSYNDIINKLYGEIPETVLNDIVRHHINNCIVVEIDYISIIPTYDNCFRERICNDCYSVIDVPSFVSIRMNHPKQTWERIKRFYECDQCGESLVTNIENSCECE